MGETTARIACHGNQSRQMRAGVTPASMSAAVSADVRAFSITGIRRYQFLKFNASFDGAEISSRIALATIVLVPIGLFMGTAFPLGMKLASVRAPQISPWLWGINGATSVCSSVVAVAIAMTAGISAAFWTGCGFYAAPLLAFLRAGANVP